MLLHGFTQTAECWGPFGAELARTHPVVAFDLPGHGRSGDVQANLPETATLLASAIDPSIVIGYSLGGRVALHLALTHPELVQRLVLIGATAGIDNAEERSQRRTDDDALALHIEDIGVETFLDEWLSQPLFASLTPEQTFRNVRARNSPRGLSSSLQLSGTGTQELLWDRLAELSMPVLIIAGANDAKFTQLGHRIVESIGSNATFQAIENAGHSAQLEQPFATAAAISEWIATTS